MGGRLAILTPGAVTRGGPAKMPRLPGSSGTKSLGQLQVAGLANILNPVLATVFPLTISSTSWRPG